MKIPKEAKNITLSVLNHPDLHWNACWLDVSGRPLPELDCQCPLKAVIEKINQSED